MSSKNAIYNPFDYGTFDFGTSQINEAFDFAWDTEVSASSRIVFYHGGNFVKAYTVGDGLTRSNGNKDVGLVLNGADFTRYVGGQVTAECTFFDIGDNEVTFKLNIIKNYLT